MRRAWLDCDPDGQLSVLAAVAYTDDLEELLKMTEQEERFGWVGDLADSFGWWEHVRYRVGCIEQINLKEARAYRTGVRRASSGPACHGTRRLSLLDSSVVRGAVSKGRSSSRRLNRVLRLIVPELLAADIQTGTFPGPTKKIPADPATRGQRTRSKPARSPPDWLSALESGYCALFDDILL